MGNSLLCEWLLKFLDQCSKAVNEGGQLGRGLSRKEPGILPAIPAANLGLAGVANLEILVCDRLPALLLLSFILLCPRFCLPPRCHSCSIQLEAMEEPFKPSSSLAPV